MSKRITLSRAAGWLFSAAVFVFLLIVNFVKDEILESVKSSVRSYPWVVEMTSLALANWFLLTFLVLCMYCAYWLGKHEKAKEPKFILDRVSTEGAKGAQTGYIFVRNTGDPSDNHIVKLIEARRISDGQRVELEKTELAALRTVAASENDRSNRFRLAHNEPKKLILCKSGKRIGSIDLECEASRTVKLMDPEPQIITVGLFCDSMMLYRIELSPQKSEFSLRLMDDKEFSEVEHAWLSADNNSSCDRERQC